MTSLKKDIERTCRSIMVASICALAAAAAFAKPGDPIPDIDVSIGKKPGGRPVKQVKSDPQGNFNFGVLPPGEYAITIRWSAANAKSYFESRSNMRAGAAGVPGAGVLTNRTAGDAVQAPKTSRPLRVEMSVTGGASPVVRPAMLDVQDGDAIALTVPGAKAITGKIVSME